MILKNAKIFLAQYDISGQLNQVAVQSAVEAKPDPRFGHTTKVHEAGLFENALSGTCLHKYGVGEIDEVLFTRIGVAGVPMTVSPNGAAAGDVAFFMRALQASYAPFEAPVGELHGGSFAAEGDAGYRLVRGQVFVAPGSRTASFNSSVIELGAVSSEQRLVAALHVLSASGTTPTLTAIVKSAAAADFLSPTNRLSFAQATAPTSELLTVVGPITQAFYRVDVTIGGTTPNFSLVCVVGITGK